MSIVLVKPELVQVQYTLDFEEPVFAVFGNPANLYTNFLRHLGPFGATLKDLRIDLSDLAQANAGCLVGSGHVRVWVDHLEVFLRDVQSQKDVKQFIESAWAVMSATDKTFRPARQSVALSAWARTDEAFSTYVRRFVTTPRDADGWKPSVEFSEVDEDGKTISSVRLEEAASIPGGLFVRSVLTWGPIALRIDELLEAFDARLRAQLARLDLELRLRS